MSFLQFLAKQIKTNAGVDLETRLTQLAIASGTNSLTFPDGTILKWGTVAGTSVISGNTSLTVTQVFPVAFPTQCDLFLAIMSPSVNTDFYGVTSLVAKSKTQAQFTVRNGASAQSCSGGLWVALGK